MKKSNSPFIIRCFVMVDGKKVALDMKNTNLADRCKLALVEMVTGQRCEFEQSDS